MAARALQGIGAALAAPTGIALLTTNLREGAERNRAFAIYSTVAGSGLALGLVLGGILSSGLSWRWVLFINVPFGALAVHSHRASSTRPRASPAGSTSPARSPRPPG